MFVGLCPVVPGPSGCLHPAGAGEGSRVPVGQQSGAGGCFSVPPEPSFQPAGGDSEPHPL